MVIIDYSWMYIKNAFVFRTMSNTHHGITYHTGGMYGCLRDIRLLKARFPGHKIVVALEGEDRDDRKELLAAYKSGRNKDPEIFQLMFETIRVLQHHHQVDCISTQCGEADDVIYTLVKHSVGSSDSMYLYAKDNDLLQCSKHRRDVFYVHDAKASTIIPQYQYCMDKYGVDVEHILMYRCIIGDASDCIPPIRPRFPRAKAKEIARVCRDVKDFEAYTRSDGDTELFHLAGLLERNLRVATLRELPLFILEKPGHSRQNLVKFGIRELLR